MRTAIRSILVAGAVTWLAGCTASRVALHNSGSLIHGEVAPGFEEVYEEFRTNITERGELGAACVIYYQGEKVVDLWGGYRDSRTREPWEENTMVLVFSVTKGLAAMTLAVAHSYGYIDYDEKVSTYWPEFAQNGKEDITVRQLLAHQAGVILLDEPLTLEEVADRERLAEALAQQKPLWEAGMRLGYHASTLGFYMSELITRVDPKHRSLGQFFQEEIAQPLDLECYIGLPADVPDSRIAQIYLLSAIKMLPQLPPRTVLGLLNPYSAVSRIIRIPRDFHPNSQEYRTTELPSANAIGQVRSIAKAYSVLARGGHELDLSEETIAELTAPAITPPEGPRDPLREADSYFSLGFEKPGPNLLFGSSQQAFGTAGFGGAFAFDDPAAQVGYAFASMKMGYALKQDPREKALREAMYRCIKRLKDKNNQDGNADKS